MPFFRTYLADAGAGILVLLTVLVVARKMGIIDTSPGGNGRGASTLQNFGRRGELDMGARASRIRRRMRPAP